MSSKYNVSYLRIRGLAYVASLLDAYREPHSDIVFLLGAVAHKIYSCQLAEGMQAVLDKVFSTCKSREDYILFIMANNWLWGIESGDGIVKSWLGSEIFIRRRSHPGPCPFAASASC